MSTQQDSQSRTEKPTPKKLLDSKKKGQVARSRELNTTVMLLAASLGLILFSSYIGNSLQTILKGGLSVDSRLLGSNDMLVQHLGTVGLSSIIAFLPFFVLMMCAVFVGPLILGGWSFTVSAWQPKWNRMSMLSGVKRMFGIQGLVEMLKSLGKFLTIGVVAYVTLNVLKEKILTMSSLPVYEGMYAGMTIIAQLFLMLSVSLILIAMIDVPYQLVTHFNKLKMSVQEIKDENKQINGNPELRAKVRSLQRDVSQRRMLVEVADADVVITNPTHYAVAIKYDENRASAPIVVASGVDFMALRIREVAAGNNVAVFEAPPLARTLYRHTEVGQELPAALYHAAAQVLAYVYQVRDLSASERRRVESPRDFDIPDAYQVSSDDETAGGRA